MDEEDEDDESNDLHDEDDEEEEYDDTVEPKDDEDDDDVDEVDAEDDDDDDAKAVLNASKASAHCGIPTLPKQIMSSSANLYTNGLEPPKYNKMHKAQNRVSADAPGFQEALEDFKIPDEMMYLYAQCLKKPRLSR